MMKGDRKYLRSVMLMVVLGFMITTTAFARNTNPGVLPPNPNSHPFGKTYGEWSAEHWKWLYSLPVDNHPLFDTADCNTGQSGKVFFLGGTFTVVQNGNVSIGTADRNCVVPTGKALFFPIIDAECSTVEGNGTTEEELRSCAEFLANHAGDLQAEIDGVAVQNLNLYRVQSPLFTFGPLPNNNVLQSPPVNAPAGTTSPSVSDGFFLMLAPLSAGEHTIHFSGNFTFTQAEDDFDFQFIQDITYHITVVGGKK